MSVRYPPAVWNGRATAYGSNPDHGRVNRSLVLHTTETVGMPGFNNGDTGPHLTYDTRDRTWQQWAEFDRYVGTMKGHSTGHWNCQAIQVEILAYSSRDHCPPNGWWVGELANEHFADLAALYRWLIEMGMVGLDLHAEPPGGWLYGTQSPFRLTQPQFDLLNGLTAHGGVGGNTHWDTGVLDLQRIYDEATQGETPVIDLETWANTLRVPQDIDRMAAVNIITESERAYWVQVPLYLDEPTNQRFNPEWQDLRNAVDVRGPIWVG